MPNTTASHNPKEWWSVAECVVWICTRRLDCVAALRDMNAEDAIGYAMMRYVAGWRVISRRTSSGPESVAGRGATEESDIEQGGDLTAGARRGSSDAAILPGGGLRDELADSSSETPTDTAPSYDTEPAHPDETVVVTGAQAVEDLLDTARSGRVKMIGRKDGGDFEPVQPFELDDLSFRIVPGQTPEPVGLWMHARDSMVWTALRCLRADVMVEWPARNRRTAAVSSAILRHLRVITRAEASPTKAEARDRCLAEVPDFYPQAFEDAWRQLEPGRKRRRGKHGLRAH